VWKGRRDIDRAVGHSAVSVSAFAVSEEEDSPEGAGRASIRRGLAEESGPFVLNAIRSTSPGDSRDAPCSSALRWTDPLVALVVGEGLAPGSGFSKGIFEE
jgi:hypothetical protein